MSIERRSSYRCPVPLGGDEGQLIIGTEQYDIRQVDESAGGFSISCSQAVTVPVGTQAQLKLASGQYYVEIAHCTRTDDVTQIGLRRLAMVKIKPTTNVSAHKHSSHSPELRRNILVGTALFSAAVFFGLTPNLWSSSPVNSTPISLESYHSMGRSHENFLRLNSLADSSVARRLRLDESQRENIGFIFSNASKSLAQAYNEVGSTHEGAWQHESSKIVEGAFRQVVNNMTDEQVTDWIKLMREPTEE